MKILKILATLIILFSCLLITNNVQANEIPETKISVNYKYKKETNTVVVTMTANNELINNKTTWKLSDDKKQFTYEFQRNTIYISRVTDIYGRKINVPLQVIQIDETPAKVVPTYEYQKDTNTVIVTMTSDKKLINNKTTWKLSEDEKILTYEFDKNTIYTSSVDDIYGNKIYVPIEVTQIDESPAKINPTYELKKDTNTVIVTMTSNKRLLNNKTTWKLSEDEKVFTYEFETNTIYKSSVTDIYGNQIYVPLEVTQIDESPARISVDYKYKEETNTVVVTMTSDKKLINNKTTWKLSDDKKQLTYEFKENTTYKSSVTDIYGNKIYVLLQVTQIKKFSNNIGIDVSHHNGKIDWQKVKNSGIGFAIIRVGYGQDMQSQDDRMFEYNISECERLGIPYGVYLYSYALNVEHAKSEADHVLRLIKGHNPEYGIWYDLEDDDYKVQNGMPSNEAFVNIAETFCEKIKSNGYEKVGIYANLYWLNYIINSPRLDKYDKWVAQWGDECTYKKDYVMWQYTDSGKVDGIEGYVDMNKYYGR